MIGRGSPVSMKFAIGTPCQWSTSWIDGLRDNKANRIALGVNSVALNFILIFSLSPAATVIATFIKKALAQGSLAIEDLRACFATVAGHIVFEFRMIASAPNICFRDFFSSDIGRKAAARGKSQNQRRQHECDDSNHRELPQQ